MPASRTRSARAGERRLLAQELRALSHPLRLRLLQLFGELPRTTKQVAELLGEPPTRLYHHVYALEKAGLLRLKETRPNRGTTEKYFEVAQRRIGVAGAGQLRGRAGAAVRGLAATVLEQARRELMDSLAAASGASPARAPMVLRMSVPVAPGQETRMRRRVVAALKRLGREAGKGAARDVERWSVTVVCAPAPARRGSKR